MSNRPGVMVYFDLLPVLNVLDDAQAGRLFRGILEYAQDGVVPDFSEPVLLVAWAGIQDKLDRDASKYEERCTKNAFSRYCGLENKRGVSL